MEECIKIENTWDIFQKNDVAIREDFELLTEDRYSQPIPKSVNVLSPENIFIEEGAVQCGFCIPGIILAAKVLLDRTLTPTDEEIRAAISGNLCRCTGYSKIFSAVKKAAVFLRGKK